MIVKIKYLLGYLTKILLVLDCSGYRFINGVGGATAQSDKRCVTRFTVNLTQDVYVCV